MSRLYDFFHLDEPSDPAAPLNYKYYRENKPEIYFKRFESTQVFYPFIIMSCLSPVVKGTWYSVYFFVGADLFQVVFSCRIIPVLQQGWAVCSHSSTQEDWSGSLFQKQHFPTPQKCRNEVLVVPVGIFSFLSPLWYLNMKCKFLKFSFKHLRCLQRCIGPEVRYVRNKTQWDMLLRDNNQERGGVTLPGTKRSYCKPPPNRVINYFLMTSCLEVLYSSYTTAIVNRFIFFFTV